ncbi:6803_t:CDS:2, partial [Ambispora leptoticha]
DSLRKFRKKLEEEAAESSDEEDKSTDSENSLSEKESGESEEFLEKCEAHFLILPQQKQQLADYQAHIKELEAVKGILQTRLEYQEQQIKELSNSQQLFSNPKLFRLFDEGIKESLVIFAGFEVSYNSYGSKLSQRNEIWKGTYLVQHNIYLNQHFFLNLLGYCNENELVRTFTFAKLIETIAHEIAHALLVDFYPDEKEHEAKHREITEELQEYLLSMPLVE